MFLQKIFLKNNGRKKVVETEKSERRCGARYVAGKSRW